MVLPPGSPATADETQSFTQIDLLGEYRLGNLPAGRYEITAVRVRPESWRPGIGPNEQVFGPAESLDIGRATIVSLASGDEVPDVDLSIDGTSDACPKGPSVRPAPGSVTASLSGRVTAATGEPIPCAAVRVVGTDVGIPTVYTDRQGRYVIDGLRAGTFVLEASRVGYTTIRYGQRRPSDAVIPISLRAEEQRTGTDVVLPGPAVISGTIVDEYGEPIEGISVWPVQLQRVDGRLTAFSRSLPRTTDDRGQYRLIGIEPGTYVISASGRERVSDADSARGYTTTYYPGVPDVAGARRVTVSAGDAVPGIDMALTPRPTATVSGVVVNSAGQPFPATVTLEVSTRSGAASIDSWSAAADANGRFSIRNVPAGDYALKASESLERISEFGMQHVTVVDGDPPPVKIVLSGGATLEGRIVIDGDSPNVAGLGITVATVDWDYAPFARRATTMWARQQDGTFRATGVTGPSRLMITETPACEGCYLKSAQVNGIETTDVPFDFGVAGVYRNVEIVVSDAGGVIEGRVADGSNGTAQTFSVIVFPTSRDLWYPRSRHLKVQRSRADGSARVTGLPPGDYYVAAVNSESIPLGRESPEPEILEQLVRQSVQVTLNEQDRRTLTLRLVRRPDSQP